jgi:hypothetical protein
MHMGTHVYTHTQRQTWLGPYNVLLSCQSMKTPKKKFLKDKINKLETNGKNKNIRDLHRGINDFKKSYQPITNLVKDENGDLLADSHSTQNRWKNYFSQLLNVHGVNVRQN